MSFRGRGGSGGDRGRGAPRGGGRGGGFGGGRGGFGGGDRADLNNPESVIGTSSALENTLPHRLEAS